MLAANVAQHVNRLPWETWVCAEESARQLGLTADETHKVLRAGRRKGSVTVRRSGAGMEYKRVRLHPLPCQRLEAAVS
jgi:hypothetical protein